MIHAVSELALPRLGDRAQVFMVDRGGDLRPVMRVAAADADSAAWTERLAREALEASKPIRGKHAIAIPLTARESRVGIFVLLNRARLYSPDELVLQPNPARDSDGRR